MTDKSTEQQHHDKINPINELRNHINYLSNEQEYLIYLSSALNKDETTIFSNYQWRYYTISTTWYYEMYSPTMLINCVSFKLNMNVLYRRKIIDKCRKTSNFDLGFPKFAERGKPSWGTQLPKTRSFSLLLQFALIAHFCYSFCYSFFPFLAFFKIEETLRKIFWKNFKKLHSTLWRDI